MYIRTGHWLPGEWKYYRCHVGSSIFTVYSLRPDLKKLLVSNSFMCGWRQQDSPSNPSFTYFMLWAARTRWVMSDIIMEICMLKQLLIRTTGGWKIRQTTAHLQSNGGWSEAVFQSRQCPFSPANVLQFRLVFQRGKSTCSRVLKMWLVHDEIGMYHYRVVQERRKRHLTPKKPRCHGWIPISPLTESYGGGRTPEGATLLEILLASWPQHAQLWHKSFLKMWSVHNDRYIPFLWS